jgi:hypothetical protein
MLILTTAFDAVKGDTAFICREAKKPPSDFTAWLVPVKVPQLFCQVARETDEVVMSQPRSNLLGLLIVGALLCVAIAGPGSLLNSVYAANNTLHEIRGTVQAVSPKDATPIIVVKSLHGSKEEIVVGATVKPGASVFHGKKKIGLDQIHPGNSVTLKYVRTREGLSARSIVLHRN